ncbi:MULTISPECIES: polysaccharide pyruvyl transferase family protein [unclassified Butyrivibrio]|uniref:polysaccharide pyruvyl transferase family protein n=1 Tax=unclassified Butyrivibrio TaxID=2639466 RepID=UPI0003F7B095|nr:MULTISPECIES: polysaccharide pyruvyl transferase family protein [unclassified Butyrivibrio]
MERQLLFYMHAGSGNHGCEAIADATLEALTEECRNENYIPPVIITNNKEQDMKYGLGDRVSKGQCSIIEERHIAEDLIPHVMYYAYRKVTGDAVSFLRYQFKDVLKKASQYKNPIAVSIGGDNYCYPEMVNDLKLAHEAFLEKGMSSILMGCSVEPDTVKDLKDDLLKFDLITVRESISYKGMIDGGIPEDKVKLCPDPAFMLPVKKGSLPEGFVKGNTIGLNVSPMVQGKEASPGITMENYRNLIRHILNDIEGSKVLLVPHVVWKSNDDRQPLTQLYEEFKDTGRVILAEDASAEELKGLISECRIFIGARTHSTIAAYSTCVPTLVLGYSVKSRGIATDLFGTDENYVVPVQKLTSDKDLVEAFDFILKNEDGIRERLQEIMPEYSKRAADNARYIKELV